ncbi:hypothetical protein J1N35_045418 [Gossypium stocksii]|uniref:Aminotransferase-like plant mobile domain-containing protein n=1 Tax=Gossypium stocksii TaxID=47602 RepID=A0A9D3ZGH6_9ROSI|nr:hypothetical protein J1N35_045418 [Gossypium stocksii]
MGSLIDNGNHISSNINEMVQYRVLKGRIYSVGFQPDEGVIPFLELARFGSAALIRIFDLRYDLISTLVERWRPETHTFHLPCGECTITLEDVALQLGLPIDGNVVTGVSSISRPARLCYDFLGRSPSEGKFATLRFSWLKANFEYLPIIATKLEVMQAVRAYIIHLIGGVLMPDSHNSEMEHESGYRKVIHDFDIPSDDRNSFWRGVRLDAKLHGMTRRGRHGIDWRDEHEEYITMWNNRFGRIPPMDRCLDLQPSPQYQHCSGARPRPRARAGATLRE